MRVQPNAGQECQHAHVYLEPQFAAASAATPGWYCSAATARADLKNYGFLLSPLCGLAS